MKRVRLLPHDSTTSRESIELDEYSDEEEEEEEEEEEDEVFLGNRGRSSKNGVGGKGKGKSSRERIDSDKKPLMKKKRKRKDKSDSSSSSSGSTQIRSSRPRYCRCGPLCWILMGFKSVLGAMVITVLVVNYTSSHDLLSVFRRWGSSGGSSSSSSAFSSDFDVDSKLLFSEEYAPCHGLDVSTVWTRSFPRFSYQGGVRSVNVTGDRVQDIVLGFGTGADGYNVPDVVCDVYFSDLEKGTPCMGGVMALDGRDGKTIWTRWTRHEVFSVNCQDDLNKDGWTDCVAGGRAGLFLAINGRNGSVLWEFEQHEIKSDLMSVYDAQFISDLDGDGSPEVLAVHGGDELSDPALEGHMFGRILIFSGLTGKVLRWIPTPDRRESYYPPQILTRMDGEQIVLFGTGGTLKPGALYAVSLYDLYKKDLSEAAMVYLDEEKGMLTPATLADVTGDGVADVVLASFDEAVVALDGASFRPIWNATFPGCETYSAAAAGHFDGDRIPDFMVTYHCGEGYPVYEYAQTVILSGKDGARLSTLGRVPLGGESSPITLSVAGRGNDMFVQWRAHCKGHMDKQLKYSFPEYVGIDDQSHADICDFLYGVDQVTELVSFQRSDGLTSESNKTATTPPPEQILYNSTFWASLEYKDRFNATEAAKNFLRKHPEIKQEYDKQAQDEKFQRDPYRKPGLMSDVADWERAFQDLFGGEEGGEGDYADGQGILEPMELKRPKAKTSKTTAFVEGEGAPLAVQQKARRAGKKQGEQMPVLSYPDRHRVQKHRPSVLDDNFEDPYRRRRRRKRRNASVGTKTKRSKKETEGIPKVAATPALFPPLLPDNSKMDLVFATHWVPPTEVPIVTEQNRKCIERKLEAVAESSPSVSDDDFDSAFLECLRDEGGGQDRVDEFLDKIPKSPEYDAFQLKMGQMTVYRFSLKCKCVSGLLRSPQTKCGRFLPHRRQGWPAFMGAHGDAVFDRPMGVT